MFETHLLVISSIIDLKQSRHPQLDSRVTLDITDWQYRETPFGMTIIAGNGVMVITPGMIDRLIVENRNLLENKYMFSALL